jgi:hypothetical protein
MKMRIENGGDNMERVEGALTRIAEALERLVSLTAESLDLSRDMKGAAVDTKDIQKEFISKFMDKLLK